MTVEQAELLSQTGPGTPAGDLLRRYWQPIGVAGELSAKQPIKALRVLSEGLVLFRDKKGEVGLVQERCPHHGVMLYEGHVEAGSIACAEHGWNYGIDGHAFLPLRGKEFPLPIFNAKAYPVERYAGLYWAYLGTKPAPALPAYELLTRVDGRRRVTVYGTIDCNWLDLDDEALNRWHLGNKEPGETRSPAVPTHSSIGTTLWLKLPVDDTSTSVLAIDFIAGRRATVTGADEKPEVIYAIPLDVGLVFAEASAAKGRELLARAIAES